MLNASVKVVKLYEIQYEILLMRMRLSFVSTLSRTSPVDIHSFIFHIQWWMQNCEKCRLMGSRGQTQQIMEVWDRGMGCYMGAPDLDVGLRVGSGVFSFAHILKCGVFWPSWSTDKGGGWQTVHWSAASESACVCLWQTSVYQSRRWSATRQRC